MVQPWNLGPPAADYTALGSIGETFNNAIDQSRKRALEEQKRNLLATAAQGGDLSKIGLGLIGSGDVAGGAALLQLGQKNGDREFDRNLFGGAPTSIGSIGKAPAASGVPVAGPASLIQNESGGNWQAQNNAVGAGGAAGHFGRLQFGQARLQEAQDAGAIPPGTTPQAFMASPELQKQAEAWHFNDIDQSIKQNGYDQLVGKAAIGGIPITVDGLRAVAHLGGKEGMRKFVETGGRYNPADENGTRLSDYFARHVGAGAPTQVAQAPQGVAQPQGVQVAENEADVQRLEAQQAAQGQQPMRGRPVASIPGDDPVRLRQEAQAYAQTNPEAARQLNARADAAEGRGVQVAQAAPQPGSPIADVPAQGAQPAQFVIPGATPQQAQSIASDPKVQEWSKKSALARTEAGRAYAKTQFDLAVTDAKNRMEGAQETVEGKRLANEKLRRELQGEGAVPLTPEERRQIGISEDQAAYKTRSGEIKFGPAAPKITNTIDQKGESKFEEELGKDQAKRWNGYIAEGDVAQTRLADIQTLRDASRRLGSQGSSANMKSLIGPYAESLGIKVDGLSDIQLYESITNRLAPQMRATGSGSTSDIEFKGFLRALGPLSNTPAAREMIFDTFEAASRNDLARADIATRLATKEISRPEAEKALRALPNPMEGFKKFREANPDIVGDAIKEGSKKEALDKSPPPRITTPEMAKSLPSGTVFIDPNGVKRRVP